MPFSVDLLACWIGKFGKHDWEKVWKINIMFDVDHLVGKECTWI